MKYKKFVIASDSHGDMIDPKCETAILEFNKEFKPSIRIHAGDAFDFRNLRKGASDEEKASSLEDDWKMGSDFLRKYFDGGKDNHYLLGNHSFSDETEVLTNKGFNNIKEVTTRDKVAEFDPKSRTIFYSNPLGIISHHESHTYRIEGRYTRQEVSSHHDVLIWGQKITAHNLVGQLIGESAISCSGYSLEASAPMDEQWLRLLVWVIMDGCIVNLKKYNPKTTKARIQFKLSEERKIARLRALLDNMGLKYTFRPCKKSGINIKDPFYIRIYGDTAREIVHRLGGVKEIPASWAKLPASNLEVFLDELQVTDGSRKDRHISWMTTSLNDVNVVQEWCLKNSWDCAWYQPKRTSGFANAKVGYLVKISRCSHEHHECDLKIDKVPYGRNVYCLTMPMGTVVSRLHGRVAFTGNCTRIYDFRNSCTGLVRDYAADGIKRLEALARKCKARTYPYDSALGIMRLGKLNVVHGYHAGANACRQHANVYGNCVFGHVHTIESAPVAALEPAEARSIGCLCIRDMDYVNKKTGKLRWGQGWGYGILFEDGSYHLQQARNINGKFVFSSDFIVI
jgi:hypothetical protein